VARCGLMDDKHEPLPWDAEVTAYSSSKTAESTIRPQAVWRRRALQLNYES
jgi:hypothetical protein